MCGSPGPYVRAYHIEHDGLVLRQFCSFHQVVNSLADVRLAKKKYAERSLFRECLRIAVIQPGGSVRDPDVIAAADRLGIAMVFSGVRHFKH